MLANKRYWVLGALLFTCLIWCSGGAVQAEKFGDIPDEEWAAEPPADYPEVKAAVLFDVGELTIKINRKIRLDRHVRIKVFQKEGADDALTVEIPFSKGDDIQNLKAHTITPDGKKHEIKDWYDKKVDDYRIRTATFPAVEDGSILEYRYRLKHERYHHIDPWYFQGDLYTIRSRIKVMMDPGFTYNVEKRCIPFTHREPTAEEQGQEMHYTWELENQPPVGDEPLSCARDEFLSSLRFQLKSFEYRGETYSYIKSWADLGETLHDYYTSFIDDSTFIAAVADSLCDDLTEQDDIIRRLFEYVRTEIKKGDSDDDDDDTPAYSRMITSGKATRGRKNLLLVELLRTQEIDACALLIGTRDDHTTFNPTSHHLTQFNHTVCCLKDGKKFHILDPGYDDIPYPYIPAVDLVEGGLLIQGDSSKPISLHHPNRRSGIDIMSEMHLRPDGSAACSATVYIRGYRLKPYYDILEDTAAGEEIIEALIGDDALTTYDLTWSQMTRFDEDDYIQIDMKLELGELATVLDDNLFFSPCLLPIMNNPFTTDRRQLPIDFYYPQTNRHRLQVMIPEGYEVADLPEEIIMQIDGMRFNRTMRHDDTGIDMALNIIIERPWYRVNEYADLKEIFDKMAASSGDQIALAASVEPEPEAPGGEE
jgi:hypothetical protein